MSKMADEGKNMEYLAKFITQFFKPIKLTGIDQDTENVLKAIWRINYINENYKAVENVSRLNNDRTQSWVINLLSILQESYYDISKTFYKFNDKYSDLFGRVMTLIQNEDVSYDQEFKLEGNPIDIRAIFTKNKKFVISGLSTATQNMLGHTYFKSRPRKFVKHYIRSLEIMMSLNSKHAMEYMAAWIDKIGDKLVLCEPFPEIFLALTLHKTMYAIRKKDYEGAMMILMVMVKSKHSTGANSETFKKVSEVMKALAAKLEAPVLRKLEEYVSIDNGMITINE